MCGSGVDGAAALGSFQNWSPVASNDASSQMPFLQREAQRAANQAGSDDGDLLKGHGKICNL
jgi:hypothetical protein